MLLLYLHAANNAYLTRLTVQLTHYLKIQYIYNIYFCPLNPAI